MSTFSFAEGAAMFDSTPIENLFLLEYLPTAPEAFLRVYLYTRVLALHPELGGDLPQMARALRMEEETVYDAFTYWEQQGLVRRLTDRPPTYELLPVRAENQAAVNPMERDYYAYRDFNASLQALFGVKVLENHEYRIANDWLNVFGYDQDAVIRLVQYGIATSRVREGEPSPASVFKRMNALAEKWADEGCRTLEDVERAIAERQGAYPVAQAVLKRFSLRRKPTLDELDCVKRWMGEWKYTEDQILEACGETTKARTPSFGYLDSILKNRLDDDQVFWDDLTGALKELDSAGAKPTPEALKRYAALRRAGFEKETIELAAVRCHERKKTRFEDVEKMLAQWGGMGVYTVEAARAYVEEMCRKEDAVAALLEAAGSQKRPAKDDLALYDGWTAKYDPALIAHAAACVKGQYPPMEKLGELLSTWEGEGVSTVEAAEAWQKAHKTDRKSSGKGERAPANPALDYSQREYKDEDFGEDFYYDVMKKHKEGGDQA